MRHLWSKLRYGISARIYLIGALSLLMVGGQAVSSIHFAEETRQAAGHLYAEGFLGVRSASELEVLFSRHRRVVESAPAELDRQRLANAKVTLDDLNARIQALVIAGRSGSGTASNQLLGRISGDIPELVSSGAEVLRFASNFAQDRALAEAQGPYDRAANNIGSRIQAWRDERVEAANEEVAKLVGTSATLVRWVTVGTMLTFMLIGPVGGMLIRRILRRLSNITAALRRLAEDDFTVQVPYGDNWDEIGDVARAVQVFKAKATALDSANLLFEAALNHMSQGLCMFDAQNRMLVCNDQFIKMFGLSRKVVVPGMMHREILEYVIALGIYKDTTIDELVEPYLADAGAPIQPFVRRCLSDGRTVAISNRSIPGGRWVSTYDDITERLQAEARMAHMARHDALTELPNRILFGESLTEAVSRAVQDRAVAVLCLDLDNFKAVNDTFGHPIGDALLRQVAQRLRSCVRKADVVARLGGDEFAIVQCGAAQPSGARELAEIVVERLREPFDLEGYRISVGISVGIAVAPADGEQPDRLLKSADMALYRAKADGRGVFRFFEAEMDARMQARHQMEVDLRDAVTTGGFELHYQPLVNLSSGQVSGFEALVRWRHPQRGLVPPGDFIPLAEETGLIVPLGHWILRQACADAALWPVHMQVAVNLSAVQFKSDGLVLAVMSAMAAAHLPAHRLELEITETILLQDTAATLATLHQLRDLGIRIAMDDFGTGYSSLSYLQSFPFDKIKIDQSFVRHLFDKEASVAIVRAVTSLAESLGIRTTAEGVETLEQLAHLKAEGCGEAQGYLFSRPKPIEELSAFLRPGPAELAA